MYYKPNNQEIYGYSPYILAVKEGYKFKIGQTVKYASIEGEVVSITETGSIKIMTSNGVEMLPKTILKYVKVIK